MPSLVARAAAQDPRAFAEIYDRYVHAIYRYCLFQVRRQADAEDLTEQVFLRAWQAIGRFRPGERPFSAWLYRIARNAIVDHLRAANRQVELAADVEAPARAVEPGSIVEQAATIAELRAALRQLPAEHRQIVLLRFVEGMSHDEVATVVGKSSGAVRVIQHRALKRLRQILERMGHRD
ncbi:MAG TPA: sigma-70 family RNA polymerase sigma factor [Dehalococcoidia bacterium]|nr:sigma-70 family RNA polymerase sigma factor [Dehalococcoidia bacterium]